MNIWRCFEFVFDVATIACFWQWCHKEGCNVQRAATYDWYNGMHEMNKLFGSQPWRVCAKTLWIQCDCCRQWKNVAMKFQTQLLPVHLRHCPVSQSLSFRWILSRHTDHPNRHIESKVRKSILMGVVGVSNGASLVKKNLTAMKLHGVLEWKECWVNIGKTKQASCPIVFARSVQFGTKMTDTAESKQEWTSTPLLLNFLFWVLFV